MPSDVEELRSQVADLQRALEHRTTIGIAIGIIVASNGVSPDRAFQLLLEQSQAENRKLWRIAEELVARRAGDARSRDQGP